MKSAIGGSNSRPLPSESNALSTELRAPGQRGREFREKKRKQISNERKKREREARKPALSLSFFFFVLSFRSPLKFHRSPFEISFFPERKFQ